MSHHQHVVRCVCGENQRESACLRAATYLTPGLSRGRGNAKVDLNPMQLHADITGNRERDTELRGCNEEEARWHQNVCKIRAVMYEAAQSLKCLF